MHTVQPGHAPTAVVENGGEDSSHPRYRAVLLSRPLMQIMHSTGGFEICLHEEPFRTSGSNIKAALRSGLSRLPLQTGWFVLANKSEVCCETQTATYSTEIDRGECVSSEVGYGEKQGGCHGEEENSGKKTE